jgi:hypothetical protein
MIDPSTHQPDLIMTSTELLCLAIPVFTATGCVVTVIGAAIYSLFDKTI